MEMKPLDRRILLSSLVEIKELQYELQSKGNLNSVASLDYCVSDRAGRLERGEYFDRDSPKPPPHRN